MTSYNITAIRAALKTQLAAISSVQNVYDYMNPKIDGYPAVIFDVTNEDGTMLDDANNLRVITFTIWAVTEVKVLGQSAAKDSLDSVVKDVVNSLEKITNATLAGTADWVMPVIGRRTQVESPEGLVMYQEIMLKVNVASTIL